MHYHEWINNFFSKVNNNISITDTHRITYLQNSVSGRAKDLIHAYSCDPSYYNTALNEIMSRFGDPSVVVNDFINQLESWKCNSSYNKQSFIAFSSFLKRLVQAFQNLDFQANLQSSTLLRKAKEKVPHNMLLKWTEYTLTENVTTTTLVEFQKWLDVQARVYDKVNQENRTSTFTHNKNGNYPAVSNVQQQTKTSGPQNWSPKNRNNSQTQKSSEATQNKITQVKPKSNLRYGKNFGNNDNQQSSIWMDLLTAKILMSTKYLVHRKIGLSSYSCCQYPLSKKIKYSTRMLSLTPAVSLGFN